MKLSELLQKRRRESGISQKRLSVELGYTTPQFVSNMERGLCYPPPASIKKIARIIKAEPGELEEAFLKEKMELLKRELGI